MTAFRHNPRLRRTLVHLLSMLIVKHICTNKADLIPRKTTRERVNDRFAHIVCHRRAPFVPTVRDQFSLKKLLEKPHFHVRLAVLLFLRSPGSHADKRRIQDF